MDLAGWILAFWVALRFTDDLASTYLGQISVPSLRLALAFFILLVSVLLLAALVNFLVGKLLEGAGLSGTDRMLGIIFGVGRGAVIIAVLVLLAGLTALPEDPWWHESLLLPHFERLAVELRGLLPPDVAAYFQY